jgi:RHS repeat-associated protein
MGMDQTIVIAGGTCQDVPVSTTSPDGAVTTYAYALPTSSTPATVVATTSYTTWNRTGDRPFFEVIYARWTRTVQDGFGRTIQTDTGTGEVSDANSISRVLTVYGPCACTPVGKVTQVSRPFNPNTESPVYTTYTYDALGRTTSIIQPANSGSTTYVYAGNTVTVTDPGGRWKKYKSDVFGNVTQVNEPNPSGGSDYVTNYTYNEFDKLTSVSMPRAMPGGNVITQTRTFVYDSHQQLISVTHPESGTTTYTYDAYGRVATKVDAKGNVITYTYDVYGRVTQITRTAGFYTVEPEPTTTFSYDAGDSSGFRFDAPWGRLTKITHSYGLVQRFSYTVSGRLNRQSYTLGSHAPYTQNYAYDTEGHLATADVPEGYRWWSYDAFGRQVSVGYWRSGDSIPPVSYAKNATFNAAGQLTSYELDPSLSRGLSTYSATRGISLSYNALGQLTSQTSVMLSDSYTYSATANDGRILGRTVYTPAFQSAIAYGYDSLGRLTTADATGAITNSSDSSRTWGQSFVYDPFGNLLQQNVTRGSAPALSLYVDSTTNRIAMQSFAYDAAGNLTQTPSGATLSYDSENRLSRFIQSGSTTNYYNGVNGERLFDGTYWYLYGPDGYQARLSQDSSGKFFLYTDDMSLSGKQVVLQGRAVLADRVGSLLAYGVSAGPYSQMTPAASLYYPYGQPPGATYTYRELYNFATYADDGNGLYYAKHRYYDSARGRFTSPDPAASGTIARPNSWNRYAYTEGDPVNHNDPDGLFVRNPSYPSTGGTLAAPVTFLPSIGGGVSGHPYLRAARGAEEDGGGVLPNCDDLLRGLMASFLQSKSSPLLDQDAAFISEVMTEAKLVGVDPRLFVAETAESRWGTSNVATTMNNPFGLKNNGNSSFDSVGDAVSAEGSTLNKYVNKYNFTISQMYSGLPGVLDKRGWSWVRPPAYCQGAGCVALGGVISGALKDMGGDPDKLKYPAGQVGSTKCN